MLRRDRALDLLVGRRLVTVRPQEVADGEVAPLLVAVWRADVEVELARPGVGKREEAAVGQSRIESEEVTEALQRFDIALPRLQRGDGELEVDDRLGRQARDGRGADVLEAHRQVTDG